jgi:tetratricopeptide (TPR) repeat protein
LIDSNTQEEKGSEHVKKSIEDFKKAVELSVEKENELQLQDKIKPKLWLARAKLKNKQVEEAIADFQAVLQIDELNPIIYDGLA